MKFLAAVAALASAVSAQTLCDQFGYHSEGGFYFNNNMWGQGSGSGSQCTYVDDIRSDGVSWRTDWQWSGGENNVKSYPYSGRQLDNKRLISDIGSIPSSARWDYYGDNVRANVAYDLFTAADPNHDPSSGDFELMIWLGRLGGVYPIGNSVGWANINGADWEVFDGFNGNMHVYSFVAPSDRREFGADLKHFFNHLISNFGYPASQQHLITLQFGTEPFTGGPATFQAHHWGGSVN